MLKEIFWGLNHFNKGDQIDGETGNKYYKKDKGNFFLESEKENLLNCPQQPED